MTNSLRNFPARLLLAGALVLTTVPGCAFAQDAEHRVGESSGSGEEKPGMELWKWANFAILAGILGYLISRNMGPMLVTRSQQIEEGLAAGERAKAEADARAAAVSAKLSGLGDAISAMRADARMELEREGARLKRDTVAELTRIQQNAAFEIESATKLARLSVQRYAAKMAIDLAEQKVRARMSGDVQSALIQNFLGEIGSSTGAGKLS
jgi:F-type H+-transporting ATPase subunit b